MTEPWGTPLMASAVWDRAICECLMKVFRDLYLDDLHEQTSFHNTKFRRFYMHVRELRLTDEDHEFFTIAILCGELSLFTLRVKTKPQFIRVTFKLLVVMVV